ncbi:hypothetical protein [Fodinibius salsisoli]|uniref:DUF2231 domain-containing protein n=1 Tax=Fodinibius salsisoli TaxID=2820877 RepID=A0ABT3PIY5_9BACT|nr:hypothetical protein [Fodinibius salsisoli]MCW9705713.1 hypothetical protein [Fodinibius salsisoli]
MDINAAHLHLMVNHVPILATFFSMAILAWGMVVHQQAIKKVALVGFILAGLTAVIAVQSGERAEDIVESVPGVSEEVIHDHEEAAETAQWLTIILGVSAIVGLFMMSKQTRYSKHIIWFLLIYSLAVGSMLAYTAYLGGKIMHPELTNDGLPSQGVEGENNED